MNLETVSQIADILSCFIAFLVLIGLGFIYNSINKQSSKNNIIVNGNAVFEKSLNLSNKVEQINKK